MGSMCLFGQIEYFNWQDSFNKSYVISLIFSDAESDEHKVDWESEEKSVGALNFSIEDETQIPN